MVVVIDFVVPFRGKNDVGRVFGVFVVLELICFVGIVSLSVVTGLVIGSELNELHPPPKVVRKYPLIILSQKMPQ